MKRIYLAAVLACIFLDCSAQATKPVNFSLVPDVAVYGRTEKIKGFTLSLWGENEQTSLALGVVNGFRGASTGVGLAVLLNYSDSYTGGQLAAVNWTKTDFLGFQGAILNFVAGQFTGFQWAAFNYAGKAKGLQLGLINYAENADALIQVGFVNVIAQNKEWFAKFPKAVAPAMIVANWRFR